MKGRGRPMECSAGEKIRTILDRRRMSITELSKKIGTSRQNLTNKLSRDNFSEKEMQDIANALNCTFNTQFTMNDTGETI